MNGIELLNLSKFFQEIAKKELDNLNDQKDSLEAEIDNLTEQATELQVMNNRINNISTRTSVTPRRLLVLVGLLKE